MTALTAVIVNSQLCACAGKSRPVLTESELQQNAATDAQAMATVIEVGVGKLLGRIDAGMDAAGGEQQTLNILAMSGGGDYGAFGAGFLVGWGEAPEGHQRPEFDLVTGVSTGALLAPFAYLGTDEDCLTVEQFYRNPKKDWIRERPGFFFWPSNPSFAILPGLTRDVAGVIDQGFIERMAAAYDDGRLMVVSSTNIDLGRQKFWNMGEEAVIAAENNDPSRIHDRLIASASIPVAFPPMEIDGFLYVDGGVTANVFFRLDPKNPNGFIQRWEAEHPGEPLPRVRYWVIVNNSLRHIPKTTQPKWPAIAGPALETSIRSATLAEIRWLAAEIDFVNELYDADIELRVVGIPDDWRPPVSGDFKKETMDSLADVGRKMGADPASWQVWAAPSDGD